MERDGKLVSLWQNGMPAYTAKNNNLPGEVMDITIIGGGITGLTTALLLQRSGKKCILVENHTIGFGTTGGTTAHINSFFDTSYKQIEDKFGEESAKMVFQAAGYAVQLIKDNIHSLNIECQFEYRNAFLFSKNKKQTDELEKIIEASMKAGLSISYTDKIPVNTHFEKAAIIPNQAQFHPVRYIYALAKKFEEEGGIILQNCLMESFDDEVQLLVNTSKGTIQSRQMVLATHIPPGINLLHFRCAPYRSYVLAVHLKNNEYPESLVYDLDEPYHYYRSYEIENRKFLIFGGEDHKTGHNGNAMEHFAKLENYLKNHFEIESIPFKWSSQYYEPADGLPYIGKFPGHSENIFVATGFSGNGMTYSHVAAKELTGLILTGESTYGKLFDPGRIKPVAGFANFVKENADVIKEFIAKRVSAEKVESFGEIPDGEGKIIKYEGDLIGFYKSTNGVVNAIDPVCTHARCIVQWNNAEHTWDCPCHGARYSTDGTVLTGPSSIKLDNINII